MSQDNQPAKLKVTVKLHPAAPTSQLHAVGMPRKRGWPWAKFILWLLLAAVAYFGWQMWQGGLPATHSSSVPAPMVRDVAKIPPIIVDQAPATVPLLVQHRLDQNSVTAAKQGKDDIAAAGATSTSQITTAMPIAAEPVVPVAAAVVSGAVTAATEHVENSSPHSPDVDWPVGFSRLVLTADLEQLEPGAPLANLVPAAEVQRLYLFTELSGYAGQELRHRWYYQNQLQTEVVLTIEDSPWRTYSEKWLLEGQLGQWRVEIVDQAQNVLYQRNFSYQ